MGIKKKLLYCLSFFVLFSPSYAQETVPLAEIIPLEKRGGVYHVPIQINEILTLPFILDTGAAEMNIPAELVEVLRQSGTLSAEDFLEEKRFILADGRPLARQRFLIRKIKIGTRVLRNVPAVVGDQNSPLLLGQSLLEKVGTYTFDPKNNVLILHEDGKTSQESALIASAYSEASKARTLPKVLKPTEDVVQKFFDSVAKENFAVSWSSLSSYSKNMIVSMVAEEAETSPEFIRQLFENNHQSVQNGFWTSFRQTSRIPTYISNATYQQIDKKPAFATVQVEVGVESFKFEVYQENGEWKLGLIESIEKFRDQKNQEE